MSTCRSCGAPIVWARHAVTDRVAPIDAEPVEEGNIILDMDSLTYTVGGISYPPGPRHTNHFATCPDAARWRSPEEAA